MDPVSVALLAALAGGAGGELGQQAWAGLTALVRRPFRRSVDDGDAPSVSSGEAELARLGEEPGDRQRAQALSTALAVRAAWDAGFCNDLETWYAHARTLYIGESTVHNTISGGSQYGPVLQGRDFSGISFTTPPPRPSGTGEGPADPAGSGRR